MKQVVLNQYPSGTPAIDDFRVEEIEIPAVGQGQFLLRTIFLGIEPRQRPMLNPTTDDNREMRPHGAPCGPGKVIPGSALGEVVESRHADFAVGDLVEGFWGWSEYVVTDGSPHPTNNPAGCQVRDTSLGAPEHHLGLFGLPGITAFLAVEGEGKLQTGETMVVSTAAGMVGSIAAQLGKLAGARVVGLTSLERKCDYLRDELNLDGAINYRAAADLKAAVSGACPDGVDYFFDNCGGPIAEAVVAHLNPHGRYTGCGFIAHYNQAQWGQSDHFRGMFSVHQHVPEYGRARRSLADLLRNGQLRYRTTVFEGLEEAPRAFIDLLEGKNIGKYLVRVGQV